MTTKEAIVKAIGKETYNGMLEAGVSDISILENACLKAFIAPLDADATEALKLAMGEVWDVPPGSYNLKLTPAQ